jgi:TolB-like protein/DNA-binding winged helix-turn-helix (wHTH) protein
MMPAPSEDAAVIRIGKWRVDPALDEISSEGRTVRLEPLAMRLLLCLARHAGRPVEQRQLLDEVWPGVIVSQGSVYQAIAQLRRTLGDDTDHPTYIDTVPRKGYRLIAPVSPWVTGSTEPSAPGSQAAPVPPKPPILTTIDQTPPTPIPKPARPHAPALLGGAVCVVAVIGALTWLARNTHAPADAPTAVRSIAVLPFVDLSETKDQEYFADGLAEELLNVLATVPELRVIGRTSSFQFKGKSDDLRTIGVKLGAAYIVEGSVRRSGSHVRVTTQLARTADGAHEWSGTYDRNIDDTLQLESEIATALGRALEISVANAAWLAAVARTSPEANDHFLRGLHALDTSSRDGLQEAASQFQAVIALDPQFASAYEFLGLAHLIQAEDGFVPPDVGFPQVREDALKALKLNSRSVNAHAQLALVATMYSWEWSEAQRESDTALSFGSQSWSALYAAANLATVLGDFDRSERLFRASLVLDPLSADSHFMLSQVLMALDRPADAEVEARRGLAITPTYVWGHHLLGVILMLEDRREEAIVECKRETPEGGQLECLAEAFHTLGHAKEANAALEQAIQIRGDEQPFWIAITFAHLGQEDLAFEWLDRAYRQKDPDLPYIKTAPEFKYLRDSARYKAFLHKMNLPE